MKPLPFPLPQVTAAEKRRAADLLRALEAQYPGAHCELNFSSPHELLIATILSAQCTDAAVNRVTPHLFKAYPTPADYARATPADLEPIVRPLGFFRNKARAIHESMKAVCERFGGTVPAAMEDLLLLRGVARKTANVVLGNAFHVNEGIPIDTHIQRLSRRFALAPAKASVDQIERRLMALFPRERWCDLSHVLIWHGRRACKARGATCADHPICARFGTACENRAKPGKAGGKARRSPSKAAPPAKQR